MAPFSLLPPLPDLALRVAFAGNLVLPPNTQSLEAALEAVFATLAQRLVEISRQAKDLYSIQTPTLRLITGLAEGADALAANIVMLLPGRGVRAELAAVLPFGVKTYRQSRSPDFHPIFDRLTRQCAYILTLDGHYEEGDTSKPRRTRAYRAQATVLLRQADILLAVLDPEKEGRSGGTLETIHAALAFDLPVLYVHALSGKVQLLRPGTNVITAMAGDLADTEAPPWETELMEWVTNLVANIERGPELIAKVRSHEDVLLEEFFGSAQTPPTRHLRSGGTTGRKKSYREGFWGRVERWFRPKEKPIATVDKQQELFGVYHRRASLLNYHFSGLYRGTFLLTYLLAVVAVTLAAFSLVLLSREHSTESISILFLVLAVLGGIKLTIVTFIYLNTRQANRGNWNDRAVDYRYLAERLRTFSFLTRTGSFRPPSATPSQFASRAVRQSAVDWLFGAIVRSSSPARLGEPTKIDIGEDQSYEVVLIQVDASSALQEIHENWLTGQIAYHNRNASTMGNLQEFGEYWGKRFSLAVILAVALDVFILLAVLNLPLPLEWSHRLHASAPWLIFLAAFLPAAVASLNGIRFQSECRRLSDRSVVVSKMLGARNKEAETLKTRIDAASAKASDDPGTWSVDVLLLGEHIARDLVKEVAEWSVLYAKDLVEP